MSLSELDRLLDRRHHDPDLAQKLSEPMDLDAFLSLAAEFGCSVTEADVYAAQQRELADQPSAELQRQQAATSRRLRSFIQG